MIIGLKFYDSSKKPTIDCQNKSAILYNPCDGFHIADNIVFNDKTGEFDGFYTFMNKRFSDDFYKLWAILPEPTDLS